MTSSTPIITRHSFAVGQQWRDRSGGVWKIVEIDTDPDTDFPICADGYWYRADGTSCLDHNEDDLIEIVSGPAPTTPNTKPQPMNCQEVISELILNAARGAVPADAEQLMLLPDCGPRNKRLMPLLIGLVEAVKVTTRAIEDNALDEGFPIDAALVFRLQVGLRQVETTLSAAAVAPKKP